MRSIRVSLAGALAVAVAVVACGTTSPGGPKAQARAPIRPYQPKSGARVECRGPANLSSARVEGRLDDLRASCRSGEPRSCRSLAEQEPQNETDMGLARDSLRRMCDRDKGAAKANPGDFGIEHDRTCSCGQYGIVLMSDMKRRFDLQGIELVDDACSRGLLDACDLAQLVADVCVYEDSPVCADLRAQSRIRRPTSDEGARVVELPASLVGCFRVDEVLDCSAGRMPDDHYPACAITHPVGSVVCLEQDRIAVREPGKPWDQVRTSWRGFAGVGMYWSSYGRLYLRTEPSGAIVLGRERLSPASADLRREARALPRVEEACARAKRCVDAVRRARSGAPPPPSRPPPSASEDSGEIDATAEISSLVEPTPTLLGCLQEERAARAVGAKLPTMPAECR